MVLGFDSLVVIIEESDVRHGQLAVIPSNLSVVEGDIAFVNIERVDVSPSFLFCPKQNKKGTFFAFNFFDRPTPRKEKKRRETLLLLGQSRESKSLLSSSTWHC